MSKSLRKAWYSEGRSLIRTVDRWVSRRQSPAEGAQEADWLGWDGWVRPEGPREIHDSKHAL